MRAKWRPSFPSRASAGSSPRRSPPSPESATHRRAPWRPLPGSSIPSVWKTTASVVQGVRDVCRLPVLAKLTPNVTDIAAIAQAAAEAGADAVTLVNTFQGMAIDWRKRQAILGNVVGGLSGPAIKPMVLKIVWQVARKVKVPIIGVGGI